jgi:hypothetical protein
MRDDIELILRFPRDGGFAWRELERLFGEIDSIAYQVDRDEVFHFCRRYAVPALLRDASLERLRRFRNQRVIVGDIRHGSIEIVFTLAATAGVVLGATLGKSTLEGYQASRFNDEFREFVRSFIDLKLIQLRRRLREAREFADAQIDVDDRERQIVLEFRRLAKAGERPPTLGEFLADMDHGDDLKD